MLLKRKRHVLAATVGKSGQTYAQKVIADGASHYWRLNETSGLVAVDSIGGANGTISGGVTLNQAGATNDGNKSMLFNGTTGQITTTTVSITPPATLELWIKLSGAVRTADDLLSARFGANLGVQWVLYLDWGSGHPGASFYTGGLGGIGSLIFVPEDGNWHYLVVVIGSSRTQFFQDGVDVSTAAAGVMSSSSGPIGIGWDPANPHSMSGSIDEVAIYPLVLTPAQIASHFAAR